LDRLEAVMAAFDEPLLRRSDVRQGRRPSGERGFMLDTVGELVTFYALASVAVIGGSFYPGVNGHNPLESAALGTPTVFGPYMRNFIDPARELLARGGAVQVTRPEELAEVLGRLLQDPAERAKLGACGREAVLANQGSIARNLDLLESVVPTRG
jgi:3-deoxy-D-manno-octulosonic-acid transferase